MNVHSAHLDLDELIADVTGRPVDDRAREHLAGCAQCRLEASRWKLVAGGVRGLVADAAPSSEPVRPTRGRRRVLAAAGRRTLLVVASAAAAVVLLLAVGAAAGLVHVRFGGSGRVTTLASVSGCPRLQQVAGTLQRVDPAGVLIRTTSGQLVRVTTTATTRLTASGPLSKVPDAVTDGTPVTVAGSGSGGAVAADLVFVGGEPTLRIPGVVTVRGTVSRTGAAGFAVLTASGTQVAVTTSASTAVTVGFVARLGQLQEGARTMALGHAGPGGTLAALAVVQPPTWPASAHTAVSVNSCSPAAIDRAIMALSG